MNQNNLENNKNEQAPLNPEVQETVADLKDFATVYEKPVLDKETEEEIEKLNAEIKFRQSPTNEAIKEAAGKQTAGDERLDTVPTRKATGLRKLGLTVGMTLGAFFGVAKAHTTNPSDSSENTKNKTEKVTTTNNESREVINSQLRLEWNKYVDWLESKGLKGNESLDHGGKGIEMVKQYISENPGTILSPEMIDDIQEEFSKYREYSLNEIKAGRAKFTEGVNEQNFMRALSIIDGIPGQRTTSFKFPQSYLSTFENKKFIKTENQGFAKIKNDKTAQYNDIARNK